MEPKSAAALMQLIENCAGHMRNASHFAPVHEDRAKQYAHAADQLDEIAKRDPSEQTAQEFLAVVNPWIERADTDQEIDADLKLVVVQVDWFKRSHNVRAFWADGFGPG